MPAKWNQSSASCWCSVFLGMVTEGTVSGGGAAGYLAAKGLLLQRLPDLASACFAFRVAGGGMLLQTSCLQNLLRCTTVSLSKLQ